MTPQQERDNTPNAGHRNRFVFIQRPQFLPPEAFQRRGGRQPIKSPGRTTEVQSYTSSLRFRERDVRLVVIASWLLLAAGGIVANEKRADPALVEVRKIWDRAPHNAFTDLLRFKDKWFCVFREGKAHVSPDGALRVIASEDGKNWTSAALLTYPQADLRDAKITVTPDNRLMLSGAAALHQPAEFKHQSLAWFSKEGREWSEAVKIGDPNLWLWRVAWHKNTAYGIGYDTAGEKFVRLYSSRDGRRFDPLVSILFDEGQPNETSLLFQPDDTALCLLRRDGNAASAKLGLARPPYTNWDWRGPGVKIRRPHMSRLPHRLSVAPGP